MSHPEPNVAYSTLPPADRYVGDHRRGEIELTGSDSGAPSGAPVLFTNNYLTVLNDHVRFPDGRTGDYMRLFHPSELLGRHGTVVVPTFEGDFFLIRLFRHPTRSWQIEFPRGFAEPDLSPAENAGKELAEELGVEAASAIELGMVAPNTGLLATRAHVFHMELKSRPSFQLLLESQVSEAIAGVIAIPRDGFLARLRSGRDPVLGGITCGFTLSAMMLAVAREILT